MIDSSELLFVVDENNNPLPPLPRKEVHAKGLWHRTTHVWVINSNHEVLCQKRSMAKDISPGKWEAWFGGHMPPGASDLGSAILELREETGLVAKPEELTYFKTYPCYELAEFEAIFLYRWDGDEKTLNYEKEEIDELKWVPLNDLKRLDADDPDWVRRNYEKDIFDWLNTKI